jgi:hypothetical protein
MLNFHCFHRSLQPRLGPYERLFASEYDSVSATDSRADEVDPLFATKIASVCAALCVCGTDRVCLCN